MLREYLRGIFKSDTLIMFCYFLYYLNFQEMYFGKWVLRNVASHDKLRDLVASETGFLKHMQWALYLGDVNCFKQAFRWNYV